eukprot:9641252-Alexandrium_andersonii.AAC.1
MAVPGTTLTAQRRPSRRTPRTAPGTCLTACTASPRMARRMLRTLGRRRRGRGASLLQPSRL